MPRHEAAKKHIRPHLQLAVPPQPPHASRHLFPPAAPGKLPDASTAVSAASISFNVYGILYMAFAAFSYCCSTAVRAAARNARALYALALSSRAARSDHRGARKRECPQEAQARPSKPLIPVHF